MDVNNPLKLVSLGIDPYKNMATHIIELLDKCKLQDGAPQLQVGL